MLFNSLDYAIFLPTVFTVYWIIKKEYRFVCIFLASYFFYFCSGWPYIFLMIGVTAVTYMAARIIEKNRDNIKICRIALSVCVLVCLGLLFWFKYFNFFSSIIHTSISLFGIRNDYVILNIVLPVGISFYTFQTMSYVVDVYKGRIQAELDFGKYAAFVSFFPQLVAGPIERSSNLLPQIRNMNRICFNYAQAMYGLKLLLWGYFKKLVIADNLSRYVQIVYENPQEYEGFSLAIASLFFTIQIYCDFSGYSDIAIGTAKLFGINLMTNFRSPYFATSIKEFWSRWHISLSTWFRDYVYIPMGGNRKGKFARDLNLMATFLLSGLWHGADLSFVAWGGCHGLAQIFENRVLEQLNKRKLKTSQIRIITRIFKTVIVFTFCTFAWIFFVSNTLGDAIYILGHMFIGIRDPKNYLIKGISSIRLGKSAILLIIISIMILFVYDLIAYKEDFIDYISSKNKSIQLIFYILVGVMIAFFSPKDVAGEFIYFRF